MPEKVYLCVPFSEKDVVKQHGAKWDNEVKRWFVLNKIPAELQDYQEVEIDIPYDDKDVYKQKIKSLYWNKPLKSWFCAKKDLSKAP